MKQIGTQERIRINERIRVPQVRVVDADGNQLGVMVTQEALKLAHEQGMDLIEISPKANPPVCKIIDYGKYKYEIKKNEREAKKKQQGTELKEIRFHPHTDDHDLNFKLNHAREFLGEHAKVRMKIVFRGREMAHTQQGYELAKKIIAALSDVAELQEESKMEGKMLTFLLAPASKKKKKDTEPASATNPTATPATEEKE
jgi:translation initiation factor IF-3